MMKVMLVEDHSVVRDGLRLLINKEPDMEVIAEAASIREVIDSFAEPNIIIADLVLSDSKGLETVRTLRKRFPAAKLVVLTMVGELNIVRGALEEGARGYLLKESAAADLIDAVRKIHKGEDYLQPSLGAAIVRNPKGIPAKGNSSLTYRESEVLKLIVLGHTNAEAAEMLGITSKTIESHRNHISQKLGLKTRAELVRFALDKGLIERT